MSTVVVVGASRGIGLELARAWGARGERVIAVTRGTAPALDGLDGVEPLSGIDVTSDEGIERLASALGGVSIDVLCHCAGVWRDEQLGAVDAETLREQFEVNAIAPLRVCDALRHRVADGGRIALITSRMGSIADNDSGGRYGYRMSKAALNAAGRSLAVDLAPRAIAVGILHPGFVRTDMTSGRGHLEPQESAAQLVQRVDELGPGNSGTFRHADGSELPW